MISLTLLLLLVAFALTIGAALGKCPVWISLLLVELVLLLGALPR